MTTIEMRRPRQSLADLFGGGEDKPTFATPRPDELPSHAEFAYAVMRACSHEALAERLAACQDESGNLAPGLFIQNIETLKLGGNGQRAFNAADGQVVPEITGVVLRSKAYRMLWDRRSKDDVRPACASADSAWGYGNPGGDCDTCSAKVYQGKEISYCRSKTRLYMVRPDASLVILDLTAMAREGLRGYLDYCRQYGWPYHQVAVKFTLNLHPRNRADAQGLNRATILAWQPIARLPVVDGYAQAIDFAQTVLSTAEGEWAIDIGKIGAQASSLDTDDYQAPPAVAAGTAPPPPPPLRAPESIFGREEPPPPPSAGQYGFDADGNVDVDDLPF